MDNLFYWIIEYLKVMFGYGFVILLWPSLVFRKYLKSKSMPFRFGFCVTASIIIMNTVSLLFGILHILNKFTIWLFFYGLIIFSFRDKLKLQEKTKRKIKYLITGTFGWKHFLMLCNKFFVVNINNLLKQFRKFYKKHWLEYSLLLLAMVYGMLYFSWSAFVEPSFAFSDVYVHHSWIYGLVQGEPFVAGIYPEGMHCVVYVIHTLFNIRIYSILLFISGINIAITIIAAYCFMNYIFKWRFTSLFAIYLFLTMEVTNHFMIKGMARAQCALPQEYAFPAVFICGLFLMRYLNSTRTKVIFEKHKNWCINGELLVFIMAVASTIAIHFYATFMAVFVCVAVAIVYWRRIFRKTHFVPLVLAAFLGLFVAAVPMGIGFMSGIPLQGSLNWAMSVISDSSEKEESTEVQEETTDETENDLQASVSEKIDVNAKGQLVLSQGASITISNPIELTSVNKVSQKIADIKNVLLNKLHILFESGYVKIYEKEKALVFVALTIFFILFWMVYRLITLFTKKNRQYFDNYMVAVIGATIFVVSFCAGDLGLPVLMSGDRSAFIGHFFMTMVAVMIFDMIFAFFDRFMSLDFMHICSAITAVGIVAAIYITDNYHSYLYYEVTRFASTVNVTNKIMASLPAETYTIVSPVEELYQVMGHGRHEEILTLCEKQEMDEYILPTEYVFIYVEKKPISYAHCHFMDGPKWLADNEYAEFFAVYGTSVTPNYMTGQISEELVDEDIFYFAKASDSYLYLFSRNILMSKIYDWCQRFSAMYPNEMKVFYEDDTFVCYYFKQNTDWLYNLVIE